MSAAFRGTSGGWRSADDDELASLLALARLNDEDVDPAHDVLPVARDQVPARLAVVRIVLLTIESLMGTAGFVRHRAADRIVHRVPAVELGHQVSRHGVDANPPLAC